MAVTEAESEAESEAEAEKGMVTRDQQKWRRQYKSVCVTMVE